MQKIPLGGDSQRESAASTPPPLPTATFGAGRFAGAPLFVRPAPAPDAPREGQQGQTDRQTDRETPGQSRGRPSSRGGEEDGHRSLPPREEDGGYVLTFVYDSATHTSELVVLEARGMQAVATARLPQHVPPLFHGSWVEEVFM